MLLIWRFLRVLQSVCGCNKRLWPLRPNCWAKYGASLAKHYAVCMWVLLPCAAFGQYIQLKPTPGTPAPTVIDIPVFVPLRQQILLDASGLIPVATLNPYVKPIEVAPNYTADKVARLVLTHLRQAARKGTNKSAVLAIGPYYRRLLLRPFLGGLIVSRGYPSTATIRQQFRQKLAAQLQLQSQPSVSLYWKWDGKTAKPTQ